LIQGQWRIERFFAMGLEVLGMRNLLNALRTQLEAERESPRSLEQFLQLNVRRTDGRTVDM
jgi:hypothetical protein